MKYNTICSLGSRCQNSDILKHYGYREFSGFFDFMNTRIIKNVNHIIANDFNEILNDDNNVSLRCNQTTIDPETGAELPTSMRTSNKYYDADPTDVHNAIFPHHDLNIEKDKQHFIKCKKRFKCLIKYNVLFTYTFNKWENDITTSEIEYMVKSLKDVHSFENFKICFVGVKYDDVSSYRKMTASKDYDIWEMTINRGSFTGGLYNNGIDNENYINLIKTYGINDKRITKEEIDGQN